MATDQPISVPDATLADRVDLKAAYSNSSATLSALWQEWTRPWSKTGSLDLLTHSVGSARAREWCGHARRPPGLLRSAATWRASLSGSYRLVHPLHDRIVSRSRCVLIVLLPVMTTIAAKIVRRIVASVPLASTRSTCAPACYDLALRGVLSFKDRNIFADPLTQQHRSLQACEAIKEEPRKAGNWDLQFGLQIARAA